VHENSELGSIDSLEAGASASKIVSFSVNQAEYDAGNAAISVEYEDANGLVGRKYINMSIKKAQENVTTPSTTKSKDVTGNPGASVTVTASSTSVKQGENVKLTYVVANTGDVAMNHVELSESALGKIDDVDVLAPGEKVTFAYTVKSIASGFTAKPRVTYIYQNKTYSVNGNSVDITVAKAKLDVSLSVSSKDIKKGESVELKGTVANEGSIAFSSVTVSESALGELEKWTNVKAGDTKTFKKTITPEDSAVYQLTVTAVDEDGKKYTYSSKSVSVQVENNPVPVTISMAAETDTVQLSSPGMVSFDISVQNLSSRVLNDVQITDQNDKLVQTISELPAGSASLQYECMVNETTSYIFTATIKVDGITSNFRSAPVEIVILDATTDAQFTSSTTTVVVTPTETQPAKTKTTTTLTKVLIVVIVVIAVVVAALIALVIYGNSFRPDYRGRVSWRNVKNSGRSMRDIAREYTKNYTRGKKKR